MPKLTYLTCLLLLSPTLLLADQEFSGYTEPLQSLSLAFPEQGIISNLYVKEGDSVKINQALASLDNRVLEAELNIAKAQYNLSLDRFQKIDKLHSDNKASDDELNRARTDLIVQKYTCERIIALIARRTITSQINGIVTEINKHPSEGVSGVETPVLKLVQIDKLILNTFIDFKIAQSLKLNSFLPIIFEDGKSLAQGQIIFISPDADKASKTVRVKLLIDNPSLAYSSGVLGKVLVKN